MKTMKYFIKYDTTFVFVVVVSIAKAKMSKILLKNITKNWQLYYFDGNKKEERFEEEKELPSFAEIIINYLLKSTESVYN